MPNSIIEEFGYQNPAQVFKLFAERPYSVFLDSSRQLPHLGRYSFIGIDPFAVLRCKQDQIFFGNHQLTGNPFEFLKKQLSKFQLNFRDDLPPFQGGVLGYFGYDLCHHLEKINKPRCNDIDFPDLILGFYDLVLAFDHELEKAWIFSSGLPEQHKRHQRAFQRLQWVRDQLDTLPYDTDMIRAFIHRNAIKTNFDKSAYLAAISKVIEYIYAGDIFEANISQRFLVDNLIDFSPYTLYLKLRKLNPAPFSAFINGGDVIIVSASPERFLNSRNKRVETRPIKGTIARSTDPMLDQQNATTLLTSEKDRAENIMIVDLMRNDLSRVCLDDSIHVPQLCGLESYQTVHHLVSVIKGELLQTQGPIELLKATFPPGSVTGAPKVRAMEIIYEIEPTARGPYCGCIGYIGFNGDMDTAVTIRTYCIKNNRLTFQTGGAIVADSNPEQEYEETFTKASVLIKTLMDDE